jgi:tight adherence protein B
MTDQDLLIGGAIACLTIVVFFVARRLLDRGGAFLPTGREMPGTPSEPLVATGPADLAGRVDRSFDRLLHHSGLGLSTGQTLRFFALTAFALAALLYFWSEEEWVAAVGPALGLALLFLILRVLQARRRRLFQRQLPDAFYFLARSLRAGLSLDQSLIRAGEQLEEPLAGELRRSAGQMQLGLHPYQALQNTAGRLGVADFNIFVSTVGLYYHSGGNLALLLDRLAASTRDRIQFLGYFWAATALGRAAGIFLAAAVPLVVIAYAVWQPEHIGDLFRSVAGLRLLAIALVLELIGIIWFFYLLRVDY